MFIERLCVGALLARRKTPGAIERDMMARPHATGNQQASRRPTAASESERKSDDKLVAIGMAETTGDGFGEVACVSQTE